MQVILIDETWKSAKGLAEKLEKAKNGEIVLLTKDEMDLYCDSSSFSVLTIENNYERPGIFGEKEAVQECSTCGEPVRFEYIGEVE